MRFRLGLFLGFAIGYVLGAKAGRERYVQIQSWARDLKRSEPAQQLSEEVRTVASRASDKLEAKANEQVAKVTQMVRDDSGAASGPTSVPPS